ncbi:MAG TPA: hypothetical protein VK932_05780, partial [Kofleriaceae bacterium]|nr:hypothetical protein [Kofleriaceae bacterium]
MLRGGRQVAVGQPALVRAARARRQEAGQGHGDVLRRRRAGAEDRAESVRERAGCVRGGRGSGVGGDAMSESKKPGPGDGDVVEIDAMDGAEWEKDQHTPVVHDEQLSKLVKQSSAPDSTPNVAPGGPAAAAKRPATANVVRAKPPLSPTSLTSAAKTATGPTSTGAMSMKAPLKGTGAPGKPALPPASPRPAGKAPPSPPSASSSSRIPAAPPDASSSSRIPAAPAANASSSSRLAVPSASASSSSRIPSVSPNASSSARVAVPAAPASAAPSGPASTAPSGPASSQPPRPRTRSSLPLPPRQPPPPRSKPPTTAPPSKSTPFAFASATPASGLTPIDDDLAIPVEPAAAAAPPVVDDAPPVVDDAPTVLAPPLEPDLVASVAGDPQDAPTTIEPAKEFSGPNPFAEEDKPSTADAYVEPVAARSVIGVFLQNRRNVAIAAGGGLLLIIGLAFALGGDDDPAPARDQAVAQKTAKVDKRTVEKKAVEPAESPPEIEAEQLIDTEDETPAATPTAMDEDEAEVPADESSAHAPAQDHDKPAVTEKRAPKKPTIGGKHIVLEYDTQAREGKPVPNTGKDDQAAIAKARTAYAAGNQRLFAGDA